MKGTSRFSMGGFHMAIRSKHVTPESYLRSIFKFCFQYLCDRIILGITSRKNEFIDIPDSKPARYTSPCPSNCVGKCGELTGSLFMYYPITIDTSFERIEKPGILPI